jgi:uncharacterized protein YdaU (DUF1376 family)
MNYYSRYPSHYLAATVHLTMEQDGAYGRLMDWYYSNERPIPDAKRYVIGRATSKKERAAIDSVLSEFFSPSDDGSEWVQTRVEKELDKAAPKIQAAKENGKKGGRPRKEKPSGFSVNNPVGFQDKTQTEPSTKAPQTPNPIHQERAEDQKQGGKPPALTLPDWLPADVWADWHAYRNTRKGWTAHARKLSLNSLCELHAAGHDPRRVIELAIERGWTGLFAPRDGPPGSLAKPVTTRQTALEENNRNVASRWAQESDEGNKHAA